MPRRTPEQPEGQPVPEDQTTPAAPEGEEKPSEVEARRAALLAKVPPPEKRAAGIYGKLAELTGLIPLVEKKGKNDFHGYSYAKESDLVEVVRPLLSAYGIFFWWSIIDRRQSGSVIRGEERQTRTEILVRFKFIDGDTGQETEPQELWADGDDPIDKGIYKSMTGAVKYALMKTFMIATGDDPEADKAADRRGAAREAEQHVNVQPARGRQPGPGGRQQEQTQTQSRILGELLRKSGARQSVDAIKLVEQMTGDTIEITTPDGEPDPAASLAQYLLALDSQKTGKLVHDLRVYVEAMTPAGNGTEEKAADEAADVEADALVAGAPY